MVCLPSSLLVCQSVCPGNTKWVPLTSCLTGLESAVWQLTIFVFIYKADWSKLVKQEGNGTVLLPSLVFPDLCVRLFVCLSVCLPVFLSVSQPVCQSESFCQSACPSFCLYVCLPSFISVKSVCLSYLFLNQFVFLSVWMSSSPLVSLSIYLYFCQLACPPVCLYVCLPSFLSVSQSVGLSVCLSICLSL